MTIIQEALRKKVRTLKDAQQLLNDRPLSYIDLNEIANLLSDDMRASTTAARRWGIEIEVCGNDNPSYSMTPYGWDAKDDGSLCENDSDWECTCLSEGLVSCGHEVENYDVMEELDSILQHKYDCSRVVDECWCYCRHADLHALDEEDDKYIAADDCALSDHGMENQEIIDMYDEEELRQMNAHEHIPECNWYIDCSYSCRGYNNQGDGEGIEFVSPPLDTVWSDMHVLTDQLPAYGDTCAGVHIHVEAVDLTPRQIGSLVWGWTMVGQALVDDAMGRSDVSYAKHWTMTPRPYENFEYTAEGTIARINRVAKTLRGTDDRRLAQRVIGDRSERYKTLNLCSLSYHGTLEFRGMGPHYDAAYLTAWASVCRGFVTLAKKGMSKDAWMQIHDTQSYLDMLENKTGKRYA